MLRRSLTHGIWIFLSIFFMEDYAGAEDVRESYFEGPVLSLRSALVRGIEKNLDLQVVKINIPISEENVTVEEAVFDPVVDASISSLEEKELTASLTASPEEFNLYRATGGGAGIEKKFRSGLESRLSFESSRSENNLSVDALDPQYRDFLILDVTQPLLRDFGTKISTANLRISQNLVRQAAYGYMARAQGIGEEIETAYYDLAKALEILRYRIESRELARELLEGNRKKFEAGIVPISEVQEAETAVASRDEQVIFTRQQVETISNRLKDLLEIRPGDPLYEAIFVAEPVGGVEQPFPNLEKALAIALEKRPDLQQQRMEVANSDIRIEFLANQKLPRIDLETTLGVNGLSGGDRPITVAGTTTSSSLVGDYFDALSGMVDADGYEWFVGLRFSYPLGNRAAKARHRRSEQEKRQTIYKLKRLEGSVETEVGNGMVSVERSMERVKVAERSESLAETTLKGEMERLKKGLSDTFRVLIFQDSLIAARISKITALVDFNKGLANLHRAMGTNLERFNILAEINTKERGYNE